jgi:hypothetical protein
MNESASADFINCGAVIPVRLVRLNAVLRVCAIDVLDSLP